MLWMKLPLVLVLVRVLVSVLVLVLHHTPHCMSEELCALVQEIVTLLANGIALRRLLHCKDSGNDTHV